ncbi:Endonuclease/exonuclease/phosphatase, partial [Lentinula edodes]
MGTEHNNSQWKQPPRVNTSPPGSKETHNIHGIKHRCKLNTKASIKIAALNIRGHGHIDPSHPKNKWNHINQIMRDRKIAILAVSEAHMNAERRDNIEQLFGTRLKILFTKREDTANAGGVAFVLNKHLTNVERIQTHIIVAGHALLLETNWHGDKRISILAIYAPNQSITENITFWQQIQTFFRRHTHIKKPDMMLGDFNMVEEQIDRLPMNKDHAQADAFETVKTDLQLIDGWRQQYPNRKAYTFMQKRAGGIQNHARLDRIYIKPTMEDNAFEWRIQSPGLHTDHSIVSLRITCETAPDIGKGRWCWPKHIMYDKYLTLYIEKEGLILQAKLDKIEDQPNRAYETQILWSDYQDRIAKEACKRAKIIIPRIDKQIKDTETNLRLIEDDQTLTDDERSLSVTLLSEKLAELENKRHQSKRQNVKARNIVHGETISRYWSAMNKSKSP